MKVSEALESRHSVRAFLPTPLRAGVLAEIVDRAKRAPSGGNIQPWHVYGVEGTATPRLVDMVAKRLQLNPRGETPEYSFYPDAIEPYTARRLKCAEDMYATIGIAREDKRARIEHLMRNYALFGAPAALFFAIDRCMDRNHWAQLGMLVQSVMLLAREYGLDTCPQEAWTTQRSVLTEFFGIPPNLMIFCGLCIGTADPGAAVNRLRTDRAPLAEFATLLSD